MSIMISRYKNCRNAYCSKGHALTLCFVLKNAIVPMNLDKKIETSFQLSSKSKLTGEKFESLPLKTEAGKKMEGLRLF